MVTTDIEMDVLQDILIELRAIRAALGQSQRSSAELAENAKGAIQISAKAYDGSKLDDAIVEVVSGFAVLKREVERGQAQQWQDTLKSTYDKVYGSEPGNTAYDLKS